MNEAVNLLFLVWYFHKVNKEDGSDIKNVFHLKYNS
jgi:hypothetical protein